MYARLTDRFTPASNVRAALPSRPRSVPDPGYDARARLTLLRIAMTAAAGPEPSRWQEPPVFFFDRRRQADYDTTRPSPPGVADPLADISARVAAELPALYASVEVRRVARAVDGLRAAAESLAPKCPAARDLAGLLAVPDDETVLVLHPERRAGLRVAVRGIADVGQFHVLAADAMPGAGMPERFVAACRDVNPTSAGGVPMVAEARFQFYAPAALATSGELPSGFAGCEHWLWPAMPLGCVPKANGERVVLLGPPAFRMTWDVTRRFPAMRGELRVLEALGPARVAEELSRLAGRPVPAPPVTAPEPAPARAA